MLTLKTSGSMQAAHHAASFATCLASAWLVLTQPQTLPSRGSLSTDASTKTSTPKVTTGTVRSLPDFPSQLSDGAQSLQHLETIL